MITAKEAKKKNYTPNRALVIMVVENERYFRITKGNAKSWHIPTRLFLSSNESL